MGAQKRIIPYLKDRAPNGRLHTRTHNTPVGDDPKADLIDITLDSQHSRHSKLTTRNVILCPRPTRSSRTTTVGSESHTSNTIGWCFILTARAPCPDAHNLGYGATHHHATQPEPHTPWRTPGKEQGLQLLCFQQDPSLFLGGFCSVGGHRTETAKNKQTNKQTTFKDIS